MLTIDEDNGQQKDGDLSAAKRNHILLLQRTYINLGSRWQFGISLAFLGSRWRFWDLLSVFGISLAFLGPRWCFWDLIGVWQNKSFSHSHTLGVECSIFSSTVCNFPESGFWIV